MNRIDRRLYGIVGNPIAHSQSPRLHTQFARQTQTPMVYAAYQTDAEKFDEFARDFFVRGCGLNVTVPFKTQALKFADRASAFADRAGVANVLHKTADGIAAFNTDGAGFMRDVKTRFAAGIGGRTVLLLGAGGAARAVAFALAEAKPAAFFILNRTTARAEELAAAVGGNTRAVSTPPTQAEVIINATSAGLNHSDGDDNALPFDNLPFASARLVYDLSYGKTAQGFLSAAKAGGAKQVCDGFGMLVWQAAMSFAVWEKIMPPVAAIINRHRQN